jgi:hypothetical protein
MSRWSKATNDTSYLMEMLKDQKTLYALLGSAAFGVLLAFPFGLGVGLVPVLGFLAGTTLAALFVPGSKKFREKVDRRKRQELREKTRNHLISEIVGRVGPNHTFWNIYNRMCERRESLKKVSIDRASALTDEDVQRLDDATVDFLGLWLGRIAIQERHQAFNQKELERRIEQIEKQLAEHEEAADQRRLQKALTDLRELVKRREEMHTRDTEAEARMLAMSDTFDEVYQRIMANPTSKEDISMGVESALERMNIEEELDYVLEEEVNTMLTHKR